MGTAGVLIARVARRPSHCTSAALHASRARMLGATLARTMRVFSGLQSQYFSERLSEGTIKGVVDQRLVSMVGDH